MYMTKVRLKNLRCFDEVVIDLRGHTPGTSVLIIGNNGLGKSALLRAIAMGLCDRTSAAALVRALDGPCVRQQAQGRGRKAPSATIAIDLCNEQHESWKITTTVTEWKNRSIESVKQQYTAQGKKTDCATFAPFWGKEGVFVAAYGAGVRPAGTATFVDYCTADAVASLFHSDARQGE